MQITLYDLFIYPAFLFFLTLVYVNFATSNIFLKSFFMYYKRASKTFEEEQIIPLMVNILTINGESFKVYSTS